MSDLPAELLNDPEIKEALKAKFLAEAEKHSAEAESFRAETELEKLNIEFSKIGLAAKKRDEAESLAQDKYHQVFVFDSEVNKTSVDYCIKQLNIWMRNQPGCSIEIVFDSPGGSVIAGLALYDFIQQVREAGHPVTTSAIGMAASMAGILLQAGDVRIMGKECWLLIHEISTLAVGKIGEIEDEVHLLEIGQEFLRLPREW